MENLRENLEQYLDNMTDTECRVSELNEINMGWETELYTFKATGLGDLVVRIFSGDRSGDKAESEYKVMKKLVEVGYPVPRVYFMERDAGVIGKPFLIMERIMGGTLDDAFRSDDMITLGKGIGCLVDLFYRLHTLDVDEFKDVYGVRTVSIDDYFQHYTSRGEQLATWLTPAVEWLKEHKPESEYAAVCHNDFHGFNILLDEEGNPYIIDWGFPSISDPRIDLGWTVLLYSTFGSNEIGSYLAERYAEKGGLVDDLDYFIVMATIRRIVDLISTLYGDASNGLKPNALEMMKNSRNHFVKVRDKFEEYTGIRLRELDTILEQF